MAEAECPLSQREIEVLKLVATGASNQDIARDLVITIHTVKVHLRNIFEKIHVQSRTEATLYAIRQGWVVMEGVEASSSESPVELAAAPGEASIPSIPSSTTPLPRPVAWWQRAYALAVLGLAAVLVFLPTLGREQHVVAATNPISDQPVTGAASAHVDTSRWTDLAALPAPRARLALAAYGGHLYAIGGDVQAGVTDQVAFYSPETDTWSGGAAKPTAVSNVGAAVVGDRIYVPGGCTGPTSVTDRMEVYLPQDDVWTQAAPMPLPVCAYAMATVGNKIYVFGGWDGKSFVDHVLVYDTGVDEWATQELMPVRRGFAAAGALGRFIYVVGGYDGASEFADTYAYDVDRKTWSPRAAMSMPRGGLGVTVINDRLYAIGGGWENYLATNERYDPVSNSWTAFESPVLGQWRNLGVAVLGTEIYAVGGWNGDYMAVNAAYQALFRIILPLSAPRTAP
jgi:DNA-binding CsgD family transcriptional regulator/N-acetylneuraminic acid mutarotase